MPLEGEVPYKHLEEHASISTLAGIMKIHPRELEDKFVTRKGTKGFPQRYLETYLYQLADKGEWETCVDVYALVVYGVLIFPNHEDFVGYDAIDVLVAVKTRAENPIPAILADTYMTLDLCHEWRNKKMLCCIPTLYVWLAARIGERTIGVKCPVELVARRGPEVKGAKEWREFFVGLNETKIPWQPSWQLRSRLIYYCGKYLNVPLVGTRCYINYNPVLAQC